MDDAVEKKIARILEYVATLESLNQNCVERMKSDRVYRGSVLYYLYTMADSCVALAEMIIKLKDLPKPQSYSEAIDILGEHQILPPEFAQPGRAGTKQEKLLVSGFYESPGSKI